MSDWADDEAVRVVNLLRPPDPVGKSYADLEHEWAAGHVGMTVEQLAEEIASALRKCRADALEEAAIEAEGAHQCCDDEDCNVRDSIDAIRSLPATGENGKGGM